MGRCRLISNKEIEKRKGAAPRLHDLTIARSQNVGVRMQPHLFAALPAINTWSPSAQKSALLILSCSTAATHTLLQEKSPTHIREEREAGRSGARR